MNHNFKIGGLALLIPILLQLACVSITEVAPDIFCEMKGGKFIKGDISSDDRCVMPPKVPPAPRIDQGQAAQPTEPPAASASPLIEPTGPYLPPTPASAQECNATLYLQSNIEITKTTQEPYYRECEYRLNVVNIHPADGIWVVRRTNTSIHSSALNTDESYWYSDLIFPGQLWEKQFRSTYYTDGQTSHEGVDRIAGVFDRPGCLYLLSSNAVEAISQPVDWACGP